MTLENLLREGFAELGLPLDEAALRRYRLYADALAEKNAVMNLTAIEGEEDVARLHFLDCAALLQGFDLRGKSLIDVGTGAGFPGLALKIACPELELTLLDSLDKRVGFQTWTACTPGPRKRPPHTARPLTWRPRARWRGFACCVSSACRW